MKTRTKILTALLLGACSVFLMGLISSKNLARDVATRTLIIHDLHMGAAVTTEGTDGIVDMSSINGVTSLTITAFSPPPFASRLELILIDNPDDDTLTCTSAQIWGVDSRGIAREETVNSLTEAADNFTVNAYESLSRVVLAGCAGAGDAGDSFVARTSEHVGLTLDLNTSSDIVSACNASGANGSAATTCQAGSALTFSAAGNALDLATTLGAADGEQITITYRGPRR